MTQHPVLAAGFPYRYALMFECIAMGDTGGHDCAALLQLAQAGLIDFEPRLAHPASGGRLRWAEPVLTERGRAARDAYLAARAKEHPLLRTLVLTPRRGAPA